jgi:hypothetical protein
MSTPENRITRPFVQVISAPKHGLEPAAVSAITGSIFT